MSRVIFLLLLSLGIVSSGVSWLRYLEFPVHDGVSRVCKLAETGISDLANIVSNDAVTVVIVENATEANGSCTSDFAEVVAQLLEGELIKVCALRISQPDFLTTGIIKNLGIHILIKGTAYRYTGRKDVVLFINYLKRLRNSEVHAIMTKLDKTVFDAVQRPRVVGFFINGTADHQAYLEAARIFVPADIPFYAVYDRLMAKRFKLDLVGQINIYKIWQKIPVSCNVNPASVSDIAVFVNRHRGTGLFHLTPNNIEQAQMDLALLDDTVPIILALGEQLTSNGAYFHRLLTKVIKNNTNVQNEELIIIWIDPEEFPFINTADNVFSKTYGLPLTFPAMGAINTALNLSVWFTIGNLNMTSVNRSIDEHNVLTMKQWLQTVINGTPDTLPSDGNENLIRAPKSQTVQSGSTFELDCIVLNVVGDCLWFRNGKHIGFNLNRFPHYSWAGDINKADCSLRVTGALAGRDDGQWHCEVAGDETAPTVISPKATIIIETIGVKKALRVEL